MISDIDIIAALMCLINFIIFFPWFTVGLIFYLFFKRKNEKNISS